MSIVLATTKVTLLQPGTDSTADDTDDWGGAPDPVTGYTPAASGIRAHLSSPSANANFGQEGNTVSAQFRMVADPCDLRSNMQVKDETTGEVYSVAWVLKRGDPIPHVVAGLLQATATA
jgi:hypothetical protein